MLISNNECTNSATYVLYLVPNGYLTILPANRLHAKSSCSIKPSPSKQQNLQSQDDNSTVQHLQHLPMPSNERSQKYSRKDSSIDEVPYYKRFGFAHGLAYVLVTVLRSHTCSFCSLPELTLLNFRYIYR